jgi:hypothetical protein
MKCDDDTLTVKLKLLNNNVNEEINVYVITEYNIDYKWLLYIWAGGDGT